MDDAKDMLEVTLMDWRERIAVDPLVTERPHQGNPHHGVGDPR
ncbi:MAG: hypothetical protein ABSC19_19660 [Syntrophorhabdales bacterium]